MAFKSGNLNHNFFMAGTYSSLSAWHPIKSAYKSNLTGLYNSSIGGFKFANSSDDKYQGILYQTDSSLFKGIWASIPWEVPGFNFNAVGQKFAKPGCAPIPSLGNAGVWAGGLRQIATSGTAYMCVTYFDNCIYYTKPTSATIATNQAGWTRWSSGDDCNVIIVFCVGGGGGGGGGATSNPLIGFSYCGSGGGGGGGGATAFFYRFDPAATFSTKRVLCFTVGAGGNGGAGKTENKGSGAAGSNGGQTICRENSFTASASVCAVNGGTGGKGGSLSTAVASSAGGIAGSVSSNANAALIWNINGTNSGGGKQMKDTNVNYAGNNGKNFADSALFPFNPVGEGIKIRIGDRGTGQSGNAAPSGEIGLGGGGGGASVFSQGAFAPYSSGEHVHIGLGGNGGDAWTNGSSDEGAGSGTKGGPGGVIIACSNTASLNYES